MKGLIKIFALLFIILFSGCSTDKLSPSGGQVEVSLAFDKYMNTIQSLPMGRTSAIWTHIISPEIAVVTIAGIAPDGQAQNVIIKKNSTYWINYHFFLILIGIIQFILNQRIQQR